MKSQKETNITLPLPCESCNGNGTYEVYHDDSEIVAGEATCIECEGEGIIEYTLSELTGFYNSCTRQDWKDELSEQIETLRDKIRESEGIYVTDENHGQ